MWARRFGTSATWSSRRHDGALARGARSSVRCGPFVAALCLTVGCAAGELTGPTVLDRSAQEGASSRATEAKVTATPENYEGVCPQRIQATARITTDGPATVKYEWESDGGYTEPERVIVFDGASTKEVQTSLPVGGSASGWVRVRIALPNALISNEASYLVTCHESG